MLAVLVDSVDPESVDALLQPEPDCALVDGFAGFRVVPVEVGLGFGVEMEVVLLCMFVPCP